MQPIKISGIRNINPNNTFWYLFVFGTRVIMSLFSKYKDIVQIKEDGFSPLHTVLIVVQKCFLMAGNEILILL